MVFFCFVTLKIFLNVALLQKYTQTILSFTDYKLDMNVLLN